MAGRGDDLESERAQKQEFYEFDRLVGESPDEERGFAIEKSSESLVAEHIEHHNLTALFQHHLYHLQTAHRYH